VGSAHRSSFTLGDRLLYLCQPMLRGDDVVEVQRRLNSLGFDAGTRTGSSGRSRGARSRSSDAGLAADKVCGPATIGALARLGSLAAGSLRACAATSSGDGPVASTGCACSSRAISASQR
jgi:N-acetylmuramoyl-L-alanine amidase